MAYTYAKTRGNTLRQPSLLGCVVRPLASVGMVSLWFLQFCRNHRFCLESLLTLLRDVRMLPLPRLFPEVLRFDDGKASFFWCVYIPHFTGKIPGVYRRKPHLRYSFCGHFTPCMYRGRLQGRVIANENPQGRGRR
jgi:hypothetical protein